MNQKPQPPYKIQLHSFLKQSQSWELILTGSLYLHHGKDSCIEIMYEQHHGSLPIQFLSPKGSGPFLIKLPLCFINDVKRDNRGTFPNYKDRTILYFWIRLLPYAFSFLTKEDCTSVLKLLAVGEDEYEEVEEEGSEISLEYFQQCLEQNPATFAILFSNHDQGVIDAILKSYKKCRDEGQLNQTKKDQFFNMIKSSIKLGNNYMNDKIICQQNFFTILDILRANPFNDKDFDYVQIFKSISNFENILQIEDKQFIELYSQTARLKFLKDCVVSMFIEIDAERLFIKMIDQKNTQILKKFAEDTKLMDKLAELKDKPHLFVKIASELWMNYKFLNCPPNQEWIKSKFRQQFIDFKLHDLLIQYGYIMFVEKNQQDISAFQKWIECLNNFMSSDWLFSQQWICSYPSNRSLFFILFTIFQSQFDQGLKVCLLNFIKNMIEPSENRKSCLPKFIQQIFLQLINNLWGEIQMSQWICQKYFELIMKVYKLEPIRSRRVLIENKSLFFINERLWKKTFLMMGIKLLQCFLESNNLEIFRYLRNNSLFKGLKEQYFRNIYSSNMINSGFRGLLKLIKNVDDYEVQEYFTDIFLLNADHIEPQISCKSAHKEQIKISFS